jgi:hypothetical protein
MDSLSQLATALTRFEEEKGVEALRQVLADGLAATCARISGGSLSEIVVERDFVSADVSVSINK